MRVTFSRGNLLLLFIMTPFITSHSIFVSKPKCLKQCSYTLFIGCSVHKTIHSCCHCICVPRFILRNLMERIEWHLTILSYNRYMYLQLWRHKFAEITDNFGLITYFFALYYFTLLMFFSLYLQFLFSL